MSGLARRLVIFATIEGLVLQAQGHSEHYKSLLIDYRSQNITAKSTQHDDHDSVRLEAHGLIGKSSLITLPGEKV